MCSVVQLGCATVNAGAGQGHRSLLESLPPPVVGETPGHMVTVELTHDSRGDFCSLRCRCRCSPLQSKQELSSGKLLV